VGGSADAGISDASADTDAGVSMDAQVPDAADEDSGI
jgi:hypothetical protein